MKTKFLNFIKDRQNSNVILILVISLVLVSLLLYHQTVLLAWSLFSLLIYICFLYLTMAGEYTRLKRSVFIADEVIHFIDHVDTWQEKENFYPFDKGIDPYDVYNSLSHARYLGQLSISEEKRKYGNIQEL